MLFVRVMNRKKTTIGLIGVGLCLFLVMQGLDVSAQQILSNGSVNTTNTTTLSNATNNNSAVTNAFDQLKDTFGSLFGK
jgi:hypothetical protein